MHGGIVGLGNDDLRLICTLQSAVVPKPLPVSPSAEGLVLHAVNFCDLDLLALVKVTPNKGESGRQLSAPTALGNVELHQREVL